MSDGTGRGKAGRARSGEAPGRGGRREIAISRPSTGHDEWEALRGPLFDGWLAQGPKVAAFEEAFAARVGTSQAVATSSGTTALHLMLEAVGIGPGDEVVVPSFTWVATANAVLYCGATLVLADVERGSYNLDPEDVARRVTKRTKAILAVHQFGLCADMERLRAAAPGVAILEDAACAVGASYRGVPAGRLAVAAAFSFHPRKVITTGEGGMVTTDDVALANLVRQLRNHGAEPSVPGEEPRPGVLPVFDVLGYNYRMTDLQGAIGLVQLEKLDALAAERRYGAARYRDALADVDWLALPEVPSDRLHAWQSFVCRVDEARSPATRDEIMAKLHARGIATRPGTHAVHALDYYRERFGYRPEDLPVSHELARTSLAIPLHGAMSDEDYAHVVEALERP